MPLTSSNNKHEEYFSVPAILFDTCAFTWFAQIEDGMSILDKVIENYCILIPTTVLFELAFGLSDVIGKNEAGIRKRFFSRKNDIHMYQYAYMQSKKLVKPGSFHIINPGFNEWWTARDRILRYMEISGATAAKSKREYSLDALIHACARNCFSPICTRNVTDFQKLNLAGAQLNYDGTVPFFLPEELLKSITENVTYSYES